jgi:anti-sigma factor RsiW
VIMHLNEKLSGYLDGELDAADRAAVEAHLETCAECRALVERMRVMKTAAQAESGEADLDAASVDRFIAENKARRAAATNLSLSQTESSLPNPQSAIRNPQLRTARPTPRRSRGFDIFTYGLAVSTAVILVIATFVALGGPLRNMFANSVGEQTMGQNQAALSAGIY